jgi:ribosomal protein S21
VSGAGMERLRVVIDRCRVVVVGNDVEAALRQLKKQMQRSGTFAAMKRHAQHTKPSERRRQKSERARRKVAKVAKRAAVHGIDWRDRASG